MKKIMEGNNNGDRLACVKSIVSGNCLPQSEFECQRHFEGIVHVQRRNFTYQDLPNLVDLNILIVTFVFRFCLVACWTEAFRRSASERTDLLSFARLRSLLETLYRKLDLSIIKCLAISIRLRNVVHGEPFLRLR